MQMYLNKEVICCGATLLLVNLMGTKDRL